MVDHSDSDSDDGIPSFLKKGIQFSMEEVDETTYEGKRSFFDVVNEALLQLKPFGSELIPENDTETFIVALVCQILSGDYLSIISKHYIVGIEKYLEGMQQNDVETIRFCYQDFITNDNYNSNSNNNLRNTILDGSCTPEYRVLLCLIEGIAYLLLYCQCNYTGPELSQPQLDILEIPRQLHALQAGNKLPNSTDSDNNGSSSNDVVSKMTKQSFHDLTIKLLECDGDYPYVICTVPYTLFAARVIFNSISDVDHCCWKRGIFLTENGTVTRFNLSSNISTGETSNSNNINNDTARLSSSAKSCLKSAIFAPGDAASSSSSFSAYHWWSARCTVIHFRLLQQPSYESSPTLWSEVSQLFAVVKEHFGRDADKDNKNDIPDVLSALYWLEWGLCQHHFEYKDKVTCWFHYATKKNCIRDCLLSFVHFIIFCCCWVGQGLFLEVEASSEVDHRAHCSFGKENQVSTE